MYYKNLADILDDSREPSLDSLDVESSLEVQSEKYLEEVTSIIIHL